MDIKNSPSGPDFIGLGAPRCGTTWIYECLREHPQVYMPYKEFHFFSFPNRWQKGREWYESFFSNRPENTKTGEFSTTYIWKQGVAEKIRQLYPDAKLIVSFRNPIDQIYSAYLLLLRLKSISRNVSFRETLEKNFEYLQAGLHSANIKKYLELFPKEQILILIYDDIKKDPLKFIQSIYKFIGINESFVPEAISNKINQSRSPKSFTFEKIIIKTVDYFTLMGFIKITGWAQKKKLNKLIFSLNTSKTNKMPLIDKKEKEMLLSYYAKDIKELEKLINRDLSGWLNL